MDYGLYVTTLEALVTAEIERVYYKREAMAEAFLIAGAFPRDLMWVEWPEDGVLHYRLQ